MKRGRREGAAVGDPDGAYQRLPARAQNGFEQTNAGQQVHAAIVHGAQVAGVVHVEVEIDVVGPDAQGERVLMEQADARQRAQALANGQRRDADEADEMGHVGFRDQCSGAAG